MKKLLLFLLCMPLIGLGQDLENTISGSYSFGISPDSGRTGHLDIYMETDSSFIFCFNLSRGAPSYNMGYLVGRATVKKGNWIYYKEDEIFGTCGLIFIFDKHLEFERNSYRKVVSVEIETLEGMYECGYGHAVYSDGIYEQYSFEVPKFYLVSPFSYSSDTLWFKDYPLF